MEFIQFIHIDKIKELKDSNLYNSKGKKYIFIQLLTSLNKYVHINTDIYIQYSINYKEYKSLDVESLLNMFLNQPIYIGELMDYAKKIQKIYKDTTTLIRDINKHNDIVYYKDIFTIGKENLYYISNIDEYEVISFIRVNV